MALDKLVDSSQLDGALTSTAEKIKIKTGAASGTKLDWNMTTGFAALIDTILTPTDGSIATKTSADLSVSGKTITAPAGYYASDASADIATGAYSADSSTSSNSTVTPSLGLDASATNSYGFTTTKPSQGTTGTNYLTLDPGASATTWSVTPRANITTAGYLVVGNKTGTAVSNTPSVSAGTNYYVPIISVSITGGGLSTTTNTNTVGTTPVVTVSSSGTFKDSTDYGVTTTKPSSGTDGTNYLTIDGSGTVTTTGKATSTVKISRAAVIYSNDAGVITSHSNTSAISATDSGNVTKDVNITPSITDNFAPLYIPIVSTTVSGGGLSTSTNINVIATTPVVTVSSSGTFTSATSYGVTTTKPNGTDGTNYLTIDGSGSVTTTGKATSTVKVARAAITYSNNAGAIAAHDSTQAIAGTDSGNITKDVSITPTVTDSFSPYYIPIVNASFSGGGLTTNTNTNTVGTAPVVTLASSGTFKSASTYGVTTTKPSGTDGTNYLTITGSGTTTNGKATSTVKVTRAAVTYTNSAGAIIAHSGTTAIDSGNTGDITKEVTITPTVSGSFGTYYIPVTSVSQGTTTVSGTTAERGIASWAKGAIAAGSIAAASFANTATSGTTYVDISDTTAAPVLVSGDYLYINKGYVDNLKISLAKLVPDSINNVSTFAAAGQILSGYVAFNKDGTGVTGTIATKSASNLSASGKTVTVPAGYYATQATKDVATGSVTPAVNSHTISTTPVVTGSLSGKGTEIGTTTKPSGTDGTDYWAFTPGGSVTTTGKSTTNAKATVSAGYIASSPANSSNSVIDITPTVSNGTTRYLTKATTSITNGTASATANAGTASIAKNPSASATATANGMDGGYYTDTTTSSYYVDCSASAASGYSTATGGSASASVTASSATVNAGYNPSAVTASTTAASTGNKTGNTATSTEVTASANKKIYLKAAGISWSGGGLSNTTNYSGTPTVSVALDSQTTSGVTITDTAQSSGYYLTLTGSTAKMTGTTKVTRAAYKETRTAGYLPAREETTILSSTTSSPSVTVNAASKTRYICLPTATFAKSGASVYCSAGGWVPTGSTSSLVATIGNGTVVASVSSNTAGSASMAATGFTASSSATDYYVTLSTSSGSVKAKAVGGTAGYVTSSTTNETAATAVTVSGNNTKLYIPAAAIAGSSTNATATTTVAPGTVSIANNTTAVSGKTRIDAAPATATSGISTYYIAVKATAAANSTGTTSAISGSGSATVTTAGYAPSTLTGSVSVSGTATAKTSAKDSSVYYIPLASAAIAASGTGSATTTVAPGNVTITNNTTAVSGKTRIDAAPTTATTGISTYYMAFKANAAANSTGTTSSITGTASATCGTAGWAATTLTGTGSVTGTATAKTSSKDSSVYYVPLASAAIAASGTASATTTVAPGTVSIAKQSTPSGVTNAASGNATTTAPTSGVYVAVKATAAANSTGTTSSITGTASATCGTAGWAATTLTGTGSVTGTATAKTSAKDSSVTYVPITTANPTFSSPTPTGGSTAVGTNCTLGSSNTSGVSVQTKYSVNAASFTYSAAVNGWVTKSSGAAAGSTTARSATNGTNYYLTGVSIPKPSSNTNSFTVVAPDGTGTHTYLFTVDANGKTSIKVDNTCTIQWNATDESLDFIYT